jgi:adenylosuccinate synthase
LDKASEKKRGANKIGSTLRGISPAYIDKTGRNALKIGEIFADNFKEKYDVLVQKHLEILAGSGYEADYAEMEKQWFEALEALKAYKFIDGEYFINEELKKGKRILAEGAQGTMLDVDFGTYPYVTSSNTISGGVCNGLGVAPQQIGEVFGIIKAYCTRVGSGPFPSELFDDNGAKLSKEGNEFGATTGRPRRCGWIDILAVKYACMLNGVTQLCVTKADVLNHFETIYVSNTYSDGNQLYDKMPTVLTDDHKAVFEAQEGWNCDLPKTQDYNQLPQALKNYISYLNKTIEVPIKMLSVGPERDDLFLL